ncbi:MAG: hypothetical protein PVI57_17320 [Gemmatimonadota bacterium]|jgi:hypothetical protein
MTEEAMERVGAGLACAVVLLLATLVDHAAGAGGGAIGGAAVAYIGPGAGLSAIGAFLALVAAVVVAIFGFVWYPVKRLFRALGRGEGESEEEG